MSMVSINYYETLEIPKNASQELIAESYRHLSLRYHPKSTTTQNAAIFEYQFHKLAEAYEVGSDPNKKNIFDIFGIEGLQNGIIDKQGNLKGKYKYSGNAHEIFEKFMGTSNPFAILRDTDKVDDVWGGNQYPPADSYVSNKPKPPAIDITIECTLEELYIGCVKIVTYKKQALNFDMKTTYEKTCEIEVEILKGYDKSTSITFNGMGNESQGVDTSDGVIHISEKSDAFYRRVNTNDGIYTYKLTLAQAGNSEPFKIRTLDGRTLAIGMDEIITPQTVKLIVGEGMPIGNKAQSVKEMKERKGDGYIKFNIIFPEFIDPDKKGSIIKGLNED